MDSLVLGMLKSDHQLTIKKQFIQKFADEGKKAQPVDLIHKMLTVSTALFLDGKTELEQSSGMKIYLTWARHNRATFEQHFTADFLVSLLCENEYVNSTNIPELILESLKILQTSATYGSLCRRIETKSISYLREHIDLKCISRYCRLLLEFPECVPHGEFTSNFCLTLVAVLSMFVDMHDSPEQFVRYINTCATLLGRIWAVCDPATRLISLRSLFSIISSVTEGELEPSKALGALIQFIPVDTVMPLMRKAVSDSSIKDPQMVAALERMISWLSWPTAKNVHIWVIGLLKGLAEVHKYSILIKVTENKVKEVFGHLQFATSRTSALAILSHMLLSFQHSPSAFHKVVPGVSGMVSHLRREGSTGALQELGNLLHCLMVLHAGFPDLYDPLLDSIQDFIKPSSEEIKTRLAENKWTAQGSENVVYLSQFAPRSETGKTGLINLGNTCYMNSILQVLYMCDEFRKSVIMHPPSAQESLMVKLQYAFTFLSHTQRSAYEPRDFLKASRPPWFNAGSQQDCSEFLKYFVDQLLEQEKTAMRTRDAFDKGHITKLPELEPEPEQAHHHHRYKTRFQEATKSSVATTSKQPQNIPNTQDENLKPTLIERTFGGKMVTSCRCLNCGTESSRAESFTDLHLAFPDNKTDISGGVKLAGGAEVIADMSVAEQSNPDTAIIHLRDLLSYYLEPEKLVGDNKYFCDKCTSLQDGEKMQRIIETPQYLILTLMRFSYDTRTHSRTKLFTDVTYPKSLYLPIHSNMKQSETYALSGVVVHSGLSSECGHYYAYSRHSIPGSPDVNVDKHGPDMEGDIDYLQDKWYLFNDSRVIYSSYNSFSNVTKRFEKDTAYVLVYRRIRQEDLNTQIDLNESIKVNELDPRPRKDIQDAVAKDNALFLQEQELAARAAAQKKAARDTISTSYRWEDSDEGGPPGSCGPGSGGGFGGLDTSGSMFIY